MLPMLATLAAVTVAQAADKKKDDDKHDDDPPRTLIQGHGIGGYGAPVVGMAMIDGQPGVRFGGRGGWVANRTFGVGAFGESMNVTSEAGEAVGWRAGGVFVEMLFAPRVPVHITADAGFGVGQLTWGDRTDIGFVPFVGARLELNLVTWMRASAGPTVQFMMADGVLPDGVNPAALGGDVIFKFGAF